MNQEKEWRFITKEIHREKADKNNIVKRELLFVLEILLSKNSPIYSKAKKTYLNLN